MPFKFEKLEVYQLALAYVDSIYDLSEHLPKSEEYNLKSQIVRAATSVVLNIAEGSTAQSDPEQNRFLGMAVRSVLETVACQHIIRRRKFITDIALFDKAEKAVCVSETCQYPDAILVRIERIEFPKNLILGIIIDELLWISLLPLT